MYDVGNNYRGSVFILEGWNPRTHTFARVVHYLDHLHNPNNLAFYTEPAHDGQPAQTWLYLPLTDRLLRYKYNAGDTSPSQPPEVLMHLPDYGLSYKYGGWHLTRTIAFATLHGKTRIYMTAGSSCDYCREHEVVRASVTAMDPDGTHQQILAHGLRNAVDLRWVPNLDGGALFATNMGDDHLGDFLPEDTFFELDANENPGPLATESGKANYGWPTCYFAHGKPVLDKTPLPPNVSENDPRADVGIAPSGTLLSAGGGKSNIRPDPDAYLGKTPAPLTNCNSVPVAYTTFAAHSSPLGLAWFGSESPRLSGSFLVALHGAGNPLIGTGYRLVQFTPADRTPRDFLTGFLTSLNGKPVVHGRPCGLLQLAPDTFLLTDDYLGLVYAIYPRAQ
jgi:glucose/arabinose dehydrogenase